MQCRLLRSLVMGGVLVLGACGGDREVSDPGTETRVPNPLATPAGDRPPPKEVLEAWSDLESMSRELGELPPGTEAVITHHPNGVLQSQGFVCDHKPVGAWLYWHDNGQPQMKGTYLYGGLKDGPWSLYAADGTRLHHGSYSQGVEVGEWWYWWPNGRVQMHGDFHLGRKEGHWISWHPGGVKASEGSFIEGRKAGRWFYWDPKAQLLNASIHHHPIGTRPPPLPKVHQN